MILYFWTTTLMTCFSNFNIRNLMSFLYLEERRTKSFETKGGSLVCWRLLLVYYNEELRKLYTSSQGQNDLWNRVSYMLNNFLSSQWFLLHFMVKLGEQMFKSHFVYSPICGTFFAYNVLEVHPNRPLEKKKKDRMGNKKVPRSLNSNGSLRKRGAKLELSHHMIGSIKLTLGSLSSSFSSCIWDVAWVNL